VRFQSCGVIATLNLIWLLLVAVVAGILQAALLLLLLKLLLLELLLLDIEAVEDKPISIHMRGAAPINQRGGDIAYRSWLS